MSNVKVVFFSGLVLTGAFLLGTGISNMIDKKQEVAAPVTQTPVATIPEALVEESTKSIPGTDGLSVKNQQSLESSTKEIKNIKLSSGRTFVISGEVMGNAIAIADALATLNTLPSREPIYIVLDSPGGSVLAGAILISAMQASKSPVYTVCYTLCASMAYMIHQYGTKRYAVDRAILMSHPASMSYAGDVDRIQSMSTMMQRYTNKMELDVARRRGLTFEQYKNRVATEYWVDAEDAIKDNVVDGLVSVAFEKDLTDILGAGQKVKTKIINNNDPSINIVSPFDVKWIWNGKLR